MPMLQARSLVAMPPSGASRLTFRRLRRPTRLPTIGTATPWQQLWSWLARIAGR